MVMNLQYFGGRGGGSGRGGGGGGAGGGTGGGSGKTVAFDIDMNGAKVSYVVKSGKVYKENGDIVNLSADQIITNAKGLGYKVKTYNSKQASDREQRRTESRKETSKQLDELWYKAGPKPRKGWKGH